MGAKYVLRTLERVFTPAKTSRFHAFIRWFVWVVVGVILIGSLVFQDNIFTELPWSIRALLFSLVLSFGFQRKIPTQSEIEIQFYDDYLIVYRDKRYYDRKCTQREFNKFYYNTISSMNYDYKTQRLNIHGKIDATFFKYDKDGNVFNEPYYSKITDGGICWFYVANSDEEEIISTLEKYVGKMVVREKEAQL